APLRPLLLPEPGPLADPLQFLKGASAMGVGAFRSEWFAEDGIRVPAKAGLLARQIPECAANGLRALALRFALRRRRRPSRAWVVRLLAPRLQSRAARLLAVRIRGEALDAQIDAHELGGRGRPPLGQLPGPEQNPLAVLAPDPLPRAVVSGDSLGRVLA